MGDIENIEKIKELLDLSSEKPLFDLMKDFLELVTIVPENDIFPQANDFEKVIRLCELLKERELSADEIKKFFSFGDRHVSFYLQAGIYLGLIEKSKRLSNNGKKIFNLDKNLRDLYLIKLIVQHNVFYESFRYFINYEKTPSKKIIVNFMHRFNIPLSENTLERRSSTVLRWIKWIITTFDNLYDFNKNDTTTMLNSKNQSEMNYNSKEISNLGIDGELERNDINLESETESLKNEKRNLDKLRELLNYSSDDDSSTQYDVVYENGHYFIRELSSSEKIKQKFSTGSGDHQFSLKDRFILWYGFIAPDKHRQGFKSDLEGKINEVENKYNLSFYKSLFDIDLNNPNKEIAIIQANLAKWSPIDKSLQIFENYNRMTHGIAKEIVVYYIDFLRNKEYEKDL